MSRVLCWIGWHDDRYLSLVDYDVLKPNPVGRLRMSAFRCRRCGDVRVFYCVSLDDRPWLEKAEKLAASGGARPTSEPGGRPHD